MARAPCRDGGLGSHDNQVGRRSGANRTPRIADQGIDVVRRRPLARIPSTLAYRPIVTTLHKKAMQTPPNTTTVARATALRPVGSELADTDTKATTKNAVATMSTQR